MEALPPLEALYREHAVTVARWSARLGGPGLDVDDTVQEVFVAVQRSLPAFRAASRLTTWLYGITANVVRMRRRQETWRRSLGGTAKEVAGHLPARERSPERSAEEQEASVRLHQVLDRMSDKLRTVLILHEWEELSGEELGELLGARPNTVWVWLHRARAEFLRHLAEVEGGS